MTITSKFSVETREFLSLSHSLNYVFKYLIVFHLKRIKVSLTKAERAICKNFHTKWYDW